MKHKLLNKLLVLTLLTWGGVIANPAWAEETTVASYSRSGSSNSTEGGTFTNNLKTATGYLQDNSSAQTYYLQILSNSAYWTTSPATITFTAKLGGGTTGSLSGGYEVYVALLDASGNVIDGTATQVTGSITSASGSDFNVTLPSTNNVYGFKLYHEKKNSYNVRYYSCSLSYSSSGSDLSSDAAFADTTPFINYPAVTTYSQAPTTADGYTGTISYEITSNTAGATINATGLVTVTQGGSVTVKATAHAVTGFSGSTATYTLTVNDTRSASDLALTAAPVSLSFDLYSNAAAQVINYTTSSTGDVTIADNDYATFSIDETNQTITVTPTAVTPSAQTITVNQAADETYKSGTATFTISISDSTPYEGNDFVRVNALKYLVDGAKVVIAARFNTLQSTGYNAMSTAISNKLTGVGFYSVSSDIGETLPKTILDDIDDYCWTVGVTTNDNSTYYTFTNASGKVLGYNSGTNFKEGGNNTNWKISRATAGASAMVSGYEGFYIVNVNTDSRGVALNSSNNYGAYATSNNNDGSYNFYVDFFVEVEPVKVTAAGYATYCSENKLDFTGSGIEAYVGTIAGTSLTFTPIHQVPANTGLLLVADGGATVNVPVIASADAVDDNCLTGVNEETTLNVNDYILNVVDGKAGFYKAGEDHKLLGAHKAYIPADYSSVKSFYIDLEDDATDLNSLTPALSEGEGAIYNLAGQRMNKMQKGINIVNGKKVMK